jgi:transketolase
MSEMVAPRDVVGKILANLAEKNDEIVVLDADFNPASKTAEFKERFPNRFFQIGIAEQNMMGVAAGLATLGFRPFVAALAVFVSRRACDQVTTSIALQNLNVKILGVYPGLFAGKNGGSHQALEDIAIMRAIAGMQVLQPADAWELEQILEYAANSENYMYIRIARDPVPRYMPENYKFQLGKSVTLKQGNDITLICYGELVGDTLEAAKKLENEGVHARVINMSSIKPIDEEAILQAAEETGGIITIDNHNIYGGIGSAVCEVVTEKMPVKVRRIGIRDEFGKSGSNEEMKERFGISANHIYREVMDFLNGKK